MIDYDTYHQIKHLYENEQLTPSQIAQKVMLSEPTVRKWIAKERFEIREKRDIKGVLDQFKETIRQLLNSHPYTATQIFQRIKKEGYEGGYTTLKDYVRLIRTPRKKAYLTLSFEPGEAAQVDFAHCGKIQIGNTMRRLSLFVMVLCYSRMIYLEFILRETLEHFLSCHRHAFEYFGRVPHAIMVDNCKVAVSENHTWKTPVVNPRYADFANHYGFKVKPCTVRQPQQKGIVEVSIFYIRRNFLNGLQIPALSAANEAAKEWMENTANIRVHATTQQKPITLFANEKNKLLPLPIIPYDCGVIKTARSNKRFRINFDANRYSVPAEYASTRNLTLRIYPERLLIYHQDKLIAEHLRSYERNKDIELPDHSKKLLLQKRNAREQKLLQTFLVLSPEAEAYYRGLEMRRLNVRHHLRHIMALKEIYGDDKLARAISDALEYQAFSCEYIANLLEQRERILPQPGPLHVVRNQDMLHLDLEKPDMTIYNIDTDNDDGDEKEN